jgi:hypothetical protein
LALDLMTLMLVSTVLCFMTALLLAYVRSGYPPRYRLLLRVWAEALVLQGLGWLAFVLRGTVPDVVSVIFANVLLLAGSEDMTQLRALAAVAQRRFDEGGRLLSGWPLVLRGGQWQLFDPPA